MAGTIIADVEKACCFRRIPDDLYIKVEPWPRIGRQVRRGLGPGRVIRISDIPIMAVLSEYPNFPDGEVRIFGSRSDLLRTLATASAIASAGTVPSFVPRWRMGCPPNGIDYNKFSGFFSKIPSSIP
jgi:hypothetical protein